MNYFDTSALIKRFATEKGSSLVNKLVDRGGPPATAKVAYAEVYAGLARKWREGGLTAESYQKTCRQFERDWAAYVRVELQDEVLTLVRELIQRHPLRAYDAVHLASALVLQRHLDETITFIGADSRLLYAARAEQLDSLNPETGG